MKTSEEGNCPRPVKVRNAIPPRVMNTTLVLAWKTFQKLLIVMTSCLSKQAPTAPLLCKQKTKSSRCRLRVQT